MDRKAFLPRLMALAVAVGTGFGAGLPAQAVPPDGPLHAHAVTGHLARSEGDRPAAAGSFAPGPGTRLAASGTDGLILPRVVPPGPPVVTPRGYRAAWSDGRLNPYRGRQTLTGALQTALVWTQTVPRRLVDANSGADVTRTYRYLVYPYTDFRRQQRDLATGQHIIVKVNGQRIVIRKASLGTR